MRPYMCQRPQSNTKWLVSSRTLFHTSNQMLSAGFNGKSLLTRSRRRLFASTFCLSKYLDPCLMELLVLIESKSVGLSPTIHSIVKTLFLVKCWNTFGTCINEQWEWASCGRHIKLIEERASFQDKKLDT